MAVSVSGYTTIEHSNWIRLMILVVATQRLLLGNLEILLFVTNRASCNLQFHLSSGPFHSGANGPWYV